MNGLAQIQIQDITGRWFTISSVANSDANVTMALKSAQTMSKTHKARALDGHGNILDIRA